MGFKVKIVGTQTILKRVAATLAGITMLVVNVDSAMAVEQTRPTPSCNLVRWASDEAFDLTSLRGKVVYVDFWASWCSSCVQSFPFLNELERELGSRGFVALGINLDEQKDDAARFLAKHSVGFAIATNPNMLCPKAFGVTGMPAAYLIDRKGNIRHEHLGFRSGQAISLRTAVEQLLSE